MLAGNAEGLIRQPRSGSHVGRNLTVWTFLHLEKDEFIVPAETLGAAHRAKQKNGKQTLFDQSAGTGAEALKTSAIIATELPGQHKERSSETGSSNRGQYIATLTGAEDACF